MKEELLKGLTEEQIAKVKACKSQKEILSLAKEEGVELNDEQLKAVSGGICTPGPNDTQICSCPNCIHGRGIKKPGDEYFRCDSCGHTFKEAYRRYEPSM